MNKIYDFEYLKQNILKLHHGTCYFNSLAVPSEYIIEDLLSKTTEYISHFYADLDNPEAWYFYPNFGDSEDKIYVNADNAFYLFKSEQE